MKKFGRPPLYICDDLFSRSNIKMNESTVHSTVPISDLLASKIAEYRNTRQNGYTNSIKDNAARKHLVVRSAKRLAQVRHVMIDLETWALTPSASIAEFAIILTDSKFKVLHTFDCLVDSNSMHYDKATAEWHKQNTTLHKRIANKERSWNLVVLLNSLNQLLNSFQSDTLIWCQGLDFDLPVLRMSALTYDVPLRFPYYRNSRDLRTFLATAEILGWKKPDIAKPHQALDDCYAQVVLLESASNYLTYIAGGKLSD